jgi:ABC-type branched-subunit amino acid transport system ATPase component
MKLHTISLKNYRLIREAEIHLETGTSATVLVGPNNSGKTSVVEAIDAFLSGTVKSFGISDFSVQTHTAFNAFGLAAADIASTGSSLPTLPSISMELRLQYEDSQQSGPRHIRPEEEWLSACLQRRKTRSPGGSRQIKQTSLFGDGAGRTCSYPADKSRHPA